MPCYSGIVQSVEQWTVNPYVTGSSPVARAKISAGSADFLYAKKAYKNTSFFALQKLCIKHVCLFVYVICMSLQIYLPVFVSRRVKKGKKNCPTSVGFYAEISVLSSCIGY